MLRERNMRRTYQHNSIEEADHTIARDDRDSMALDRAEAKRSDVGSCYAPAAVAISGGGAQQSEDNVIPRRRFVHKDTDAVQKMMRALNHNPYELALRRLEEVKRG
jgi:hypothetical protein